MTDAISMRENLDEILENELTEERLLLPGRGRWGSGWRNTPCYGEARWMCLHNQTPKTPVKPADSSNKWRVYWHNNMGENDGVQKS